MTREEKINRLIGIIGKNENTIKHFKTYPPERYYQICDKIQDLKYENEILERELKLLQIKPRTIDNLEVGDVIIINNKIQNEINRTAINNESAIAFIQHDYIDEKHEVIQIIPHEFLKLWSDLHE